MLICMPLCSARNKAVSHQLGAGRKAWIQVARGAIKLNDEPLQAGDGVAIEGPATITLSGTEDSEGGGIAVRYDGLRSIDNET